MFLKYFVALLWTLCFQVFVRLAVEPFSSCTLVAKPDTMTSLQIVKEASQEAHKSPFVVMPTSVIYNGKEYATLGFADPLSRQHLGCEKNYLPLKEGWSLAQNNSESVAVIAAYGWGTTRLIASNVTYYTANAGPDGVTNFNPQSSPGTPWQAGLLQQNGSQYKVRTCANRILIYKASWAWETEKGCVESLVTPCVAPVNS